MAKVKIEGNASGTGTFTIAAPNSNTDRTLTLPDEAGTVLTSASDLPAANLTGDIAAARITDALNAGGSAPVYACRAWASISGPTATILGSGNVSSLTDNGAGDYTVNLTTAMPDINCGIAANAINSDASAWTDVRSIGCYLVSTSAINVYTHRLSDQTLEDPQRVMLAVFR